MNSTEKGTFFEDRVYKALEIALANDLLFVPKSSKIFQRKKYYSEERKGDIIVDISIECYRKGSGVPNLYILIECKDYQKPIPINDVEEFFAKKEQIAKANSKCLLFVSTSLQSSAYNYATAKGIGVVRLLDDDSMNWLIERANKNLSTSPENSIVINVINAITNEFFVSTHNNTFCLLNDRAYLKIEDLLKDLINE